MRSHSKPMASRLPHLSFTLLAILLLVLWLAGGASRADVLGQAVARAVAWLIAIVAIIFVSGPKMKATALRLFVTAGLALVAFQLIPLPPWLWTELPGRQLLADATIAGGQSRPWRPISISPDATANALSSLVIPVVVLGLVEYFSRENMQRLLTLILALIVASSLLGLLQFAGWRFDNPLTNDARGVVSGTFANPNHFALLLACGCILAPSWAFQKNRNPQWKLILASGLVVYLVLMILASGSRMGILLGLVGVAYGLILAGVRLRATVAKLPSRVWIPWLTSLVATLIIAVATSIGLGRAVSVERALSLDASGDLRRAALPTILEMVEAYWPIGTGFGTFDPAYRISEPDELLSLRYLNHAHNDWVEVVLDGGLPGLLLLLAAVSWWVWSTFRVWRNPPKSGAILSRAGAGVLLLVALASLVDYPVRTPMIMAIAVIAAVWLGQAERPSSREQ